MCYNSLVIHYVPCLGHQSGNPLDGYDYDCDYENSAEFGCDQCICNGGDMSPISGKPLAEKTVQRYYEKYIEPRHKAEEKKGGENECYCLSVSDFGE